MDHPMRLFGLAEANALIPVLNETFTKMRTLIERDDGDEIRRELRRLQELGIEVKAVDGLVDFRSLRAGEIVYLCWKFPETEVGHWHRLEGGFGGRKPIAADDAFAASYAN